MNYKKFLGAASAALMIAVAILMLAPGAWAQSKYKTLHQFSGGRFEQPKYLQGSLIFDQAGNLYGVMSGGGGAHAHGIVFKLTPNADGTWAESVIYTFMYCKNGCSPNGRLIFDQAGNLYGTTARGGHSHYVGSGGTAFKLAPNADGTWTESVIYTFCSATNCSDGMDPLTGLIFDKVGNLYGTTELGGRDCGNGNGCGVVFKLTPSSDGSWTESVLYTFCSLTNCSDGAHPDAGLTFDQAGNLYGTTGGGGDGTYWAGVAFKLAPNEDGSWTETVLHTFCSLTNCSDGRDPAGLIFDATGNLYGTTQYGGNSDCGNGCGVVFKLTPSADGTWSEKLLHQFTGGKDGAYSTADPIFDATGNLYGTAGFGGSLDCGYNGVGCGVVFKLTPNSNGGWSETALHAFRNHPGAHPSGGLSFDAAGNLYGTTEGDGTTTYGSVFEITP